MEGWEKDPGATDPFHPAPETVLRARSGVERLGYIDIDIHLALGDIAHICIYIWGKFVINLPPPLGFVCCVLAPWWGGG